MAGASRLLALLVGLLQAHALHLHAPLHLRAQRRPLSLFMDEDRGAKIDKLQTTLARTVVLDAALADVTLTESFSDDSLSAQLEQVASVVAARGTLGSNRDVFFVELIGFDTHSDMDDTLSGLLGYVNNALGSFVAEMKAQGTWGNVTIVSASDFGRTLTSNGLGTDHACVAHTHARGALSPPRSPTLLAGMKL